MCVVLTLVIVKCANNVRHFFSSDLSLHFRELIYAAYATVFHSIDDLD